MNLNKIINTKVIVATLALFILCNATVAIANILTDSRIKTLVYNENEVFKIVVHTGYQSYIELADNEAIETISLGNAFAWKIQPNGHRIFIKPMEANVNTNMTIITSKRTYNFEIESRDPAEFPDAELAFVIRFFYPDDGMDQYNTIIFPDRVDSFSNMSQDIGDSVTTNANQLNYNYTLEGNDAIAPLMVFDNGNTTFFKFPVGIVPQIFSIKLGKKEALTTVPYNEFMLVQYVGDKLLVKLGRKEVYIFNENKIRNLLMEKR